MKTAAELEGLADITSVLQARHHTDRWPRRAHTRCRAALCLKCSEVIYSCQRVEWASRQCACDGDLADALTILAATATPSRSRHAR